MPYTIHKRGDKYSVVKKDTGEVVARPDSIEGARGYIWHASHAEKKPTKGLPRHRGMR